MILAGEVVFTNCPLDPVEHIERLARGMQGLALTTCEAPRSQDRLDPMLLVLLGDCREAQNFPLLLAENVADEIVFVQPLHDGDDGPMPLVVEPTIEGVVEPFVGGLPLRVGECLLWLGRIIDQDDVGAASGQHTAG